MIGQKLGNYRIVEKIGAGGMGEVYRARDERLGRDVALKVLPPAFLSHADRVARFDREAKILATFNHPNIASIYEVEDAQGVRALIMELVEGPTLADRLKAGPAPLEEALGIARQIVEALEAAHDRGIIHRDLKPANIKITSEGRVKVLDFGLARALEDDPAASGTDQSPTLSAIATKAGIILGTAAYMSPEQAKGKPCDRRADVWSFGVVLYEMLAGRPLYSGETASEILAAVIKEEPDWSALPADTPPAIRKLLRRCLIKDPKRRLQAIGEARIAIEEYAADPNADSVVMSAIAARPAAWRGILPWALAGLLFLATALALWSPWKTQKIDQPMRLTVELGADASVATAFGAAAILSPDGARLAFVARGADQKQRLYLRALDQVEATPLSGTEGAIDPFFSPDGQWIGFFADAKLKKIATQGGAPVVLCDAGAPRGGTWSEDETIVFAPNIIGGLFRVSSAGGTPQPLTTLDKGQASHRWPQVLPGGKAVVFIAGVGQGPADLKTMVYLLRSGTHKEIHAGVMYARYLPAAAGLPSGHLVYIHEGTLFAAPFDLDKLEMTAQPAPVLEGVRSSAGTGGAQFAFSGTGALVYLPGKDTAGAPLQWLDAQGKLRPLRNVPANYGFPRFSPDGKRLALTIHDSTNVDVWVYDWARDTMSRFTFDPARDVGGVWTPDGQRLTFASASGAGSTNIYWQRADGTGAIERLTESKNPQTPWSWKPDGKALAFTELSPETQVDILVLPMEGDERTGWRPGKPQVFLNGPFSEAVPVFSPDGRWLAYSANDTGMFEVYVRPFPSSGGKWQISSGGGFFPKWSPNGKELFFRSADSRIMAATYRVTGDSFLADKPRVWSETQVENRGPRPTFDLHPDGRRFVVLKQAENEREPGIHKATLILNFSEELRRRIPVAKKLGN